MVGKNDANGARAIFHMKFAQAIASQVRHAPHGLTDLAMFSQGKRAQVHTHARVQICAALAVVGYLIAPAALIGRRPGCNMN